MEKIGLEIQMLCPAEICKVNKNKNQQNGKRFFLRKEKRLISSRLMKGMTQEMK